jgi:hypothetical protein
MDESNVMTESDFYFAMNKLDARNDIDIDTSDFIQWLKKNEESVCKPYNRKIREVLEQREEEGKAISKIIRNMSGDDYMHPFCQDLY